MTRSEDWNQLTRKEIFRSEDWDLVQLTLSANRSGMMSDVCERLFSVQYLCLHTELDSFSCQHEKLFDKVQKFFIQKISPVLIGSNLSAYPSQPTGASSKYGIDASNIPVI